jgi:hypothetical protein
MHLLKPDWSNKLALLKRLMDALKGNSLPPGDAGFGGVRSDEAVDLPPGDAGFGGVRPDEAAGPNSLANSGDSIPAFERTVTTL